MAEAMTHIWIVRNAQGVIVRACEEAPNMSKIAPRWTAERVAIATPELLADAARLDWLETSGHTLLWQYTDGTGSRSESPRFRYAVGDARKVYPDTWAEYAGLQWRPTVREAIDAAITQATTEDTTDDHPGGDRD